MSARRPRRRLAARSRGRRVPRFGQDGRLGVEHGHQGLEVTALGRGREGVEDTSLGGLVGHGRCGGSHAPSRPARQLGRGGARGASGLTDLLERDAEHVVQHESHPLARVAVQDDEQGKGHLVGLLRCGRPGRTRRRSRRGRARGRRDSSRRDFRDRRKSREIRLITVVSHPRRLTTSVVSVRDSRSQASWTASSASSTDPSMR